MTRSALRPARSHPRRRARGERRRGSPAAQRLSNERQLLHLLARVCGARNILEIGMLGAYSTIWLARALPAEGRLITLEADPRHAEVARANLARANLSDTADLRVGAALETRRGSPGKGAARST